MEFTDIPTSDLHAYLTDFGEEAVPSKHITAARLAKAEIKRKAELTVAKATQAAKLRAKHLNREGSVASSSDADADEDEEEDDEDKPEPEHHTRKPKRAPKAKLTAKEKESAREELAAAKKKRTAERRGRKGHKTRFSGQSVM